jgi:hypothetical protein
MAIHSSSIGNELSKGYCAIIVSFFGERDQKEDSSDRDDDIKVPV